tara:strand:- start:1987 stop:2547 length:561 start_codon:yes stop_codon:yes gene_type:complete
MAKEDDIVKTLGGLVAPTTLIDDPAKMLQAIRNASLIRLGIGLQTDMRAGESAFTRIGEVAKGAADQVKLLQEAQKGKGTKTKDLSTEAGKAQTAYRKLFYQPDELTGALTQLRQDFMTAKITPPTQEFFKNNLFTEQYFLGDTGQMEAYFEFHKGQTKTARERGQEGPTWEESFNTYNIIRNLGS